MKATYILNDKPLFQEEENFKLSVGEHVNISNCLYKVIHIVYTTKENEITYLIEDQKGLYLRG